MKELEELISKRWIIKNKDPETYYRIKDHAKEIRKKVQEKLGYSLIVNQHLIKLEKIPGLAEPWMGIQEFQSKLEYQMLCFLLMYLEDKELEEQFVLSNLVEYIQLQFASGEIDWTRQANRKALIRVIQYTLKMGIMLHIDGEDDLFVQDQHAEVLYENTGVSRYFMRNFTMDIMKFEKTDDFMNSGWLGMDNDRGIIRRQRVYRRLLLSAGIYKQNGKDDEDFNYIRNYRSHIESDFQGMFSCDLHLHSSSAYLNIKEDASIGKVVPANNTKDDLVLLVHENVRHRVANYLWKPDENEQVQLSLSEYQKIVKKIIHKHIDQLPKTFQIKGEEEITRIVILHIALLGFIRIHNDTVTIYPIAGKVIGAYQGGKDHVDK